MINKVIVTIVDSGIDERHNEVKSRLKYINRKMTMKYLDGIMTIIEGESHDDIGHGTAVFHAISSKLANVQYNIIKIIDEEGTLSEEGIIECFRYIHQNIPSTIIHFSAGLVNCDNVEEFENICKLIRAEGPIIIAAFSNDGLISYPASFDSVIGVDYNVNITNPTEWIYVKNSIVNIYGVGQYCRLANINNSYKNVAGASFSAAFITGIVAKYISQGNESSRIMSFLEEKSLYVFETYHEEYVYNRLPKINKAIVFPMNKENSNLLRFSNLCEFEIVGTFDHKFSLLLGRSVKEIFNSVCFLSIESYENIDWSNEFDTFILGHVSILSQAYKKDYINEIVSKCIKYKKNLVSYDFVSANIIQGFIDNGLWCYSSKSEKRNGFNHNLGKLYSIISPVLGVFGTSSKQGKFSLQLSITKEFSSLGYKTGLLGTEPNASLFKGYTFPIGYEGITNIDTKELISEVNYLLHMIDLELPDIIITGGQSHIIPISSGGIATFPLYQNDFVLGVKPDCSFLCVNLWDSFEYISKCVNYLESFFNNRVLGFFILDNVSREIWTEFGKEEITEAVDIEIFKKKLERKFNIPVFIINDPSSILEATRDVIKYFNDDINGSETIYGRK